MCGRRVRSRKSTERSLLFDTLVSAGLPSSGGHLFFFSHHQFLRYLPLIDDRRLLLSVTLQFLKLGWRLVFFVSSLSYESPSAYLCSLFGDDPGNAIPSCFPAGVFFPLSFVLFCVLAFAIIKCVSIPKRNE